MFVQVSSDEPKRALMSTSELLRVQASSDEPKRVQMSFNILNNISSLLLLEISNSGPGELRRAQAS